MASTPRRHWSFSLRTLFVVVTVLACGLGLLGWQLKIVRERQDLLAGLTREGAYVVPHSLFPAGAFAPGDDPVKQQNWSKRPGVFRRLLGDEAYYTVHLASLPEYRDESDDDELAQVRQLFPEATVSRSRSQQNLKQAAKQIYEKLYRDTD